MANPTQRGTYSGNPVGTPSRVLNSLTASWAVSASRAAYADNAGGAANSWVTANSGNLASVTSSLMTWSSSAKTEISGLNTWSASAKTSITAINTATGSLNGKSGSWSNASSWVGSNSASINTATGSAKAVSALTASLVASASVAKSAQDWVTANSGSIGGITGSSHTHSNKALLDSLTNAKTGSWDSKQAAISDLATIRVNAASGNVAYGWGNHANAGYLKSTGTIATASYNAAGAAANAWVTANSGAVAANTSARHSHSNKAILDTWTSQELVSSPSASSAGTSGTITLAAGKFTVCGTLTGTTTFALGTAIGAGRQSIYAGKFKTGATAYTVNWPSGVVFVEGSPDTSKANSSYEFSICDGIGILVRT